jgi:hypothetical protein
LALASPFKEWKMRSARSFWVLGVLFAVPLAARPQLQPFGGRSVLESLRGCQHRTLLTVRNDGAARATYRLRWLAADRAFLGRSQPRSLESDAIVEIDVTALAESLGVHDEAEVVEMEWVSERFTRLTAVAAAVPRCSCASHELERVSPLPVENESPHPIRWAEFQAVSE